MSLVRNIIAGVVGVGIVSAGAWSLDQTKRDDSGAIIQEGELGVFNFKVGDCLTNVPETGEVEKAQGVPCAQSHQYEVFAETFIDSDSEEVPKTVADDAEDFCYKEFSKFVGISYDDSMLGMMSLFPSPDSWKGGDKEYSCLVGYADGASSSKTFRNFNK